MKIFRSAVGFMIAGMLVMSVWGQMAGKYGIFGGWLAGLIIIAPMWFINHYHGMIENEDDAGFIDQGLGIAICGTMRDVFLNASIEPLVASLPTLLIVVAGGITGGICAVLVERNLAEKAALKAKQSKTVSA